MQYIECSCLASNGTTPRSRRAIRKSSGDCGAILESGLEDAVEAPFCQFGDRGQFTYWSVGGVADGRC